MFLFKVCKLGEGHRCSPGGVVPAEMGRDGGDVAGIPNWLGDSWCCFRSTPPRL